MNPNPVAIIRQRQLSEFVAESMGLHFPQERWPDLQRGLAGAAAEFGFEDVAECSDWLLSAPLTMAQSQILAGHLTIGETYFFRDMQTFEVLAQHVLPALIHARRGDGRRLRLWSAGCCTGEEAYSLAIMLEQLIPDLADWQVTILATDINPHFLSKAAAGSYGEWSFRGAPAGFKERYFRRSGPGRHLVAPRIKAMVTFAHLNLVEDVYPGLATDTNAMDLIFCRNVLMYFTPAQTRKAIGKMHHALLDGGWLAVSPSESSRELFPQFAVRNFPGAILYQKSEADAPWVDSPAAGAPVSSQPGAEPGWEDSTAESLHAGSPPPEPPAPAILLEPEALPPTPMAVAMAFSTQGHYAEAADRLRALMTGPAPDPAIFSPLVRALANQGKLTEALAWCDRWIAADKINAAAHYLHAIVLLEQGDSEQARRSLQRAAYLHPDFVLAHFASGNLARRGGRNREADKHFGNALHLLARLPPATLLPESDGLTAARLTETIAALTILENTG